MGSGRRSSKRKPSSSSSSLKKKKRYKDKSKKRSKRDSDKSRKTFLTDDSVSYSDDESASDSSKSYSSSDYDRKSRRRGKHQTGKDVKDRKRRAERIETDEDMRKRKKRKRSRDSDERKKRREKKQRKKQSVGSSRSCSTCEHSDDSDGKSERTNGKLQENEREKNMDNKPRGRTENRHRSRSCSVCSSHRDSAGRQSEESLMDDTSSRRLRSVIIAVEQRDRPESTALDHSTSGKTRSLNDHNEYAFASDAKDPNALVCGELDREQLVVDPSGDGGVHVNDQLKNATSSGENLELQRDLAAVSADVRRTKLLGSHELDLEPNESLSNVRVGLVSYSLEENRVNPADLGSSADDLEAVLRQKALENLKKFKGQVRTNDKVKSNNEGELTHLSMKKTGSVHGKYEKGNSLGLASATSRMDQISMITARRDSVPSLPKEHKEFERPSVQRTVSFLDNDEKEGNYPLSTSTTRLDQISKVRSVHEVQNDVRSKCKTPASSGADILPPSSEKSLHSSGGKRIVINQSELKEPTNVRTGALKNEPLETNKTEKQNPGSEKHFQQRMPTPLGTGDQNAARGSKYLSHDGKVLPDDSDKLASSEPSTRNHNAKEQSSNNERNEGEKGSQFEQKTMSVMRGGELVQVSYKVYIPKKAPALARRQLKR